MIASSRDIDCHCCEEMRQALQGGEVAIRFIEKFREYGILILDGGTAHQVIGYCPWCGQKLPRSLRDEWFARLRDLGLEPDSPGIPEEMKSSGWWRRIEQERRQA